MPKHGWCPPLVGGCRHRGRRPRCPPHLRCHDQVSAYMDKMPYNFYMFDMLQPGWFWSSLTSLLFRKRRAAENGEPVPTEAGWTLQEA